MAGEDWARLRTMAWYAASNFQIAARNM